VKRAIAAAGASALAARGAYAGLRRWPPGGDKTWTRTNHRGETVTLLEGPALAVGAVTAQLVTAAVGAASPAGPAAAPGSPKRVRACAGTPARASGAPAAIAAGPLRGELAVVLAGLGGLGFGVLDDLYGSAKRKGLRGHLGALAHGEVTTGTVKLAGLAATGLAAALLDAGLLDRGLFGTGRAGNVTGPRGGAGRAADVIVNAGLIAGGANLLNLFDLRPGRAIKVAALAAGLIAAGGALTRGAAPGHYRPAGTGGTGRLAGLNAAAVPAGAALALLPEDLGERAMLGDAGANALGAMLGAAAASALPRRARIGLLAAIAALTVASEKVSFTKVIEATAPLRWLDMAGRRPAPLAAPVSADPVSAEPAGPPERRRPGRRRRVAARVSRTRSGVWVSAFVQNRVPREP
jgi:UDP-GlcNAc:undecaprenyl-phosphate/decaprenyl-phosphate GlcNAc-1-phosphate transferase